MWGGSLTGYITQWRSGGVIVKGHHQSVPPGVRWPCVMRCGTPHTIDAHNRSGGPNKTSNYNGSILYYFSMPFPYHVHRDHAPPVKTGEFAYHLWC